MNRFAFAMESGVTDVRSVKQVMLEVPEAAKIWQESFHMTDQQILTAVRSGKLGARDLAVAWAQNGEAVKKVDEDFAKRQKTNEQAVKEFGEAINNLHQQQGLNGMQANLAVLQPNSLQTKIATEGFDFQEKDNGRAAQAVIDHMLQMADHAKNLTGEFRDLGDAKDKALGDMVEQIAELPGKLADVTTGVMDLGRAVGIVADKWEQGLSPLGRVVKLTMDHAAATGEAKLQLAALAEATKQGGIAGMEARKQYEALMTTLNNGELPAAIKLLDELTDPFRIFHNDMTGLNELFLSGAADIDQYRLKVESLVNALPKPSDHVASAIEEINFQIAHHNDLIGKAIDDGGKTNYLLPGTNGGGRFLGQAADVGSVPTVKDVSGTAQSNVSGFQSTLDKYDAELAKLNSQKDILGPENLAKSIKNLNEQFGAAISPAEKLAREVDDVNGLLTRHAITAEDAAKKMQQLAKEQEKLADSGKDLASGMSRGWHSIRDEASDAASDISSTMKAAFDGVNDAIVSMVTTGTADWGKLASTIEADFAKMALHKIESSIFDAASGSASGAAVGVTTGTSAATTMLAAAPGIGAAIGATAAAAIAAGSTASSAGTGIAAAIAGSWAGSETLIHAANGYSGKVGGVGGTDTKLFAAMVSPGEHVKIQTPQQAAADQRAGGGQSVTIVNKHDARGELAAAMSDRSMDTHVVNIMKRNAGAVQSLIRK